MAYTNTWSTTTPANTDSSAGAAADMRKIRLDIQERMETLLGVGNWSTDPIVVFAANNFLMYHWSDFVILSTSAVTYSALAGSLYGVTPNSAANVTLYCPMVLPRGVTITTIEIIGQTASTSTLTLTLESIDATTGTVTQTTHATATMAGATTQSAKASSVVAVTVDAVVTNYQFYYLKLVMYAHASSGAWFQGVRVNYTRSDISQTL